MACAGHHRESMGREYLSLVRRLLVPLLAGLVACGGGREAAAPVVPATGATELPGLANTGALLAPQGSDGFTDQAWQVKCERLRTDIPPCPSNGTFVPAWRVLGAPSEWVGSTAEFGFAFWIGVATNGYVPNTPGGDSRLYRYTYRATFDLSAFDPTSVLAHMDWSGDNIFEGWRVNGGALRDGSASDGQWTSWKPITLSGAATTLQPGLNTLEFLLTGDGVTDGLAVRVRSVGARRR